jgi:hypothetical protein
MVLTARPEDRVAKRDGLEKDTRARFPFLGKYPAKSDSLVGCIRALSRMTSGHPWRRGPELWPAFSIKRNQDLCRAFRFHERALTPPDGICGPDRLGLP